MGFGFKVLQDGKMCDSVAIPVDRIWNLIGKEEDCLRLIETP